MKNINYKTASRIMTFINLLAIILIFLCGSSCKKYVDIDPPVTQVTNTTAFATNATAATVLSGIYANMSSGSGGFITGSASASLKFGLAADEFTLYNGVTDAGLIVNYTNTVSASSPSSLGIEMWPQGYNFIYTCNAAIEGLNNSKTLSPAVQNQLIGEAKFTRAFFYFYLVNTYGDVPLALTTDYKVNQSLARAPKAQVWQQIIADLIDAENRLSSNYLKGDGQTTYSTGSEERVRPTKWAAAALLARAYLYYGNLTKDASNFVNAEAQSSLVINMTSYYSLTPLNSVFLKNSQEAIWQLQPVNSSIQNTEDAGVFIIPSTGPSPSNPVYLSNDLLTSFESNDQRKTPGNWIDTVTAGSTTFYFPYKYKTYLFANASSGSTPFSEYLMVLRLGEQYLIRAEARAQQGNLNGAASDLNAIRSRASLSSTTATTQSALLNAILHERQVELFSEWGHRWYDLKRTGTIDAVMSIATPLKSPGTQWQSFQQLYPVLDVTTNPNIVQNPGY